MKSFKKKQEDRRLQEQREAEQRAIEAKAAKEAADYQAWCDEQDNKKAAEEAQLLAEQRALQEARLHEEKLRRLEEQRKQAEWEEDERLRQIERDRNYQLYLESKQEAAQRDADRRAKQKLIDQQKQERQEKLKIYQQLALRLVTEIANQSRYDLTWQTFSTQPKIAILPLSEQKRLYQIALRIHQQRNAVAQHSLRPRPNLVQIYDTPGTYTITDPNVEAGNSLPTQYLPYRRVKIEAIGAGGAGATGSRVYFNGQVSYYVRGGGGGGAYVRREVDTGVTSDGRRYANKFPEITITVGAGAKLNESHGGTSVFTINGERAEAGGGQTATSAYTSYPEVGSYPIPPNQMFGGLPGSGSGTYDVAYLGSSGSDGKGQANIEFPSSGMNGPLWPINSVYSGIATGSGIGGSSGHVFAGGDATGWYYDNDLSSSIFEITASTARIQVNSVGGVDEYIPAEHGLGPGGGGSSGIVGNFGATPGTGSNGRIIVTFTYGDDDEVDA